MYTFKLKTMPYIVYKKRRDDGEPVPVVRGKETIIPKDQLDEDTFSYREQLLNILGMAQGDRGSFSLKDIRTGDKVCTLLEGAKDGATVDFEDTDWEWIKKQITAAQWGINFKALQAFLIDVEDAKPAEKVKAFDEAAADRKYVNSQKAID